MSLIPVYAPDISGNEKRYVNDCLDTSWISSIGIYTEKFEKACAEFSGVKHAIGVCNGTVALHLAIHCLDIGPGDEVIVPTFTYIASVNTIAQTGATPVFVDCCPDDWLIDPADVEAKITPRTKAIMPVHLYGTICDMTAVRWVTLALSASSETRPSPPARAVWSSRMTMRSPRACARSRGRGSR